MSLFAPDPAPSALPPEQRTQAVLDRLTGREFLRQSLAPAAPPVDDPVLDDRARERFEFMYPSGRDEFPLLDADPY